MNYRPCLAIALCAAWLLGSQAFGQEQEKETPTTENDSSNKQTPPAGQEQQDATGGFDPWQAPSTAGGEAGEQPATTAEDETAAPEIAVPSGYPTAEIDRPLALPRMMLEPRLDFVVDFFVPSGTSNFFSMRLGAGMGIIDNLEAGLSLALSFSPKVYAGMQAYGLYEFARLWDGRLAWAGRLRILSAFSKNYVAFHGATSFTPIADLPVKLKLHDMIAVTAAAGLGGSINADRPDYFLLYVDVGALVQPFAALALTWQLQVWGLLGDNSDATLPMLIGAQYTLVGDLDLYLHFGFMDLSEGADWLQLMFGACYRLGL